MCCAMRAVCRMRAQSGAVYNQETYDHGRDGPVCRPTWNQVHKELKHQEKVLRNNNLVMGPMPAFQAYFEPTANYGPPRKWRKLAQSDNSLWKNDIMIGLHWWSISPRDDQMISIVVQMKHVAGLFIWQWMPTPCFLITSISCVLIWGEVGSWEKGYLC